MSRPFSAVSSPFKRRVLLSITVAALLVVTWLIARLAGLDNAVIAPGLS
jgi:hypothetical protein